MQRAPEGEQSLATAKLHKISEKKAVDRPFVYICLKIHSLLHG